MKYVSLPYTEEEWEKITQGARADRKPVAKWMKDALLIQAQCAIDDPMPFDLPKKKLGRPRTQFDPALVDAALIGRSVRGAARWLDVSPETLRRWLHRRTT